jgi:acetaldehyde dehydrogenase (acetylating)
VLVLAQRTVCGLKACIKITPISKGPDTVCQAQDLLHSVVFSYLTLLLIGGQLAIGMVLTMSRIFHFTAQASAYTDVVVSIVMASIQL